MEQLLDLKILSKYAYLRLIKKLLSDLIEEYFKDVKCLTLITLAVSEAMANIIEHAYFGDEDSIINLQIWRDKNSIKFVLIDFGQKKNIDEIASRSLDDFREGGLGVHIIEEVMDYVKYEHLKNGTKLIMIKNYEEGKNGK